MDRVLLREELDLLPGPVLADGQSSWTIHDPQRNLFFRIDWLTFEILRRWSLGEPSDIVTSIETSTTLRPSADDVLAVSRFLSDNQLIRTTGVASAKDMAGRLAKMTSTPLKWLIHHYLFFRLPLVHPDKWLTRCLDVASLFYSKTFALLTLIALITGLGMVIRHSETFFATLVNTFNWQGLLSYGIALFLVKLMHELGHAFTAKRYGCRIPAMGIAFMVLWPMAYTDTNEAWRLTDRWQRFYVSSAGIIVELTVAAWSTLMWAILPDGDIRSAFFVLATTSWIATLAINASPFMRFDGYFILCDMIDMPNLHQRSFALARWRLREWLFDLGEQKPEYHSRGKENWLVLFAWITWIYRLVVFLGIAVLVYHFFIKLIGIMLFIVEIVWFIALPVYKELLEWKQRWAVIVSRSQSRRRGFRNLAYFTLVLVVISVPWSGRISASGILRPQEIMPVYAPGGAMLVSTIHAEGDLVLPGTKIIQLQSPEVDTKVKVLKSRITSLNTQAISAGFSEDTRSRMQVTRKELETMVAELASTEEEMSRYSPLAMFEGKLFYVDPDLKEQQWLSAREKIATLVNPDYMYIETYMDEDAVKRVSPGDEGIFVTDGLEGPVLRVKVLNIDRDTTRTLEDGMLSALAGGHIMTREQDNKLVPERAIFRITLEVNSDASLFSGKVWRGTVVIRAQAEAIAGRFVRNLINVLVRESGL